MMTDNFVRTPPKERAAELIDGSKKVLLQWTTRVHPEIPKAMALFIVKQINNSVGDDVYWQEVADEIKKS